ncbi:MAG: cysteine--tRNA ligase [Marmoricola sp.]
MTSTGLAERLRAQLSLYNTLTHSQDPFAPEDGTSPRLYVCGPTVYSSPHIGNMRTYLFADVLCRVLSLAGWDVDAAMNITDVGHLTSDADSGDDKMATAARQERKTAWQIAEKYTEAFFEDTDRLNITPFQHILKATDHIAEQIDLVRRLEDKGVLYRTDDGIYFDTSLVPDYGKLTPNDTRDHLRAGERVAMGGKRHVTDFAVWKLSDPDAPKRDMEWDSPWGAGFPGWHLECSAMAMATLGDTLDLHLGGIDHIAIHHTNEIAQSETATGKPFSRWWMHGAFLNLDGEKRMGKSEGNKVTLETLEEWGYTPLEFRYLVLLSHYRSPLAFSREALEAAAVAHRRLLLRVETLRDEAAGATPDQDWQESTYVEELAAALADDLNTPRAVAVLWNLMRDGAVGPTTKLAMVELFDQALGLDLAVVPTEAAVPPAVLELAEQRWQLRLDRRFEESDRLRDELTDAGYVVQDSRDGYQLVAARDTAGPDR